MRRMAGIAAMVLVVAACAPEGADPGTAAATTSSTSTTSTTTIPGGRPGIPGPAGGRVPVILDYSPTVSDVGALLYLLSEPSVEVIGVTLPETGEAGCGLGVEVTLGILALLDHEHVPVACGRGIPAGAGTWPEPFLAGQDNLGFGLPLPSGSEDGREAARLLADLVLSSARPVVVVAVAPLTNVARALEATPALASTIGRLVVMGGAVDVAGNVFDRPAEWNVWIDPEAADLVLSSGAPVTLVPLDATDDVPVPPAWELIVARAGGGPAMEYLARLVTLFPSVTSGGFFLWDELAAMVAVDPTVVRAEESAVAVVLEGAERGRTVRRSSGPPVTVATAAADPDGAYRTLLSAIVGREVRLGGRADEATRGYFDALDGSAAGVAPALERFVDLAFVAEPFDGEAAADALIVLADAFRSHAEDLVGIPPPSDLRPLHDAYAAGLEEVLEFVTGLEPILRRAETAEEALADPGPSGFAEACAALLDEAAYRGIEVGLPCG